MKYPIAVQLLEDRILTCKNAIVYYQTINRTDIVTHYRSEKRLIEKELKSLRGL